MLEELKVRRILVLLPNWLGDAAMATPALRALYRRFPDATITAAGKPSVCELLDGLPYVHRVLPFSPRPGAAALMRLGKALAPHAADLCVVFPHSFRAALLGWLSGASCRLGYARGGRSLLLNHRVPPHRVHRRIAPQYTALEYLNLVGALGCVDDGKGLELAAGAVEMEVVAARLEGPGPLVGLAPGAAFGPSKCWMPERFAAVADRLYEECGARCVLLTAPGEEETHDAVLKAAQVPLLDPYGNAGSISKMKAAIASLDLFVGNDSGPRHVAIAFGKPVICIMGPTSPAYTESPWERGSVLRVEVDCGPCQKPYCATDHRCMKRISVEDVVRAAQHWLPVRG